MECAENYPITWGNGGSAYRLTCAGTDSSGSLILTKSIDGASPQSLTVQTQFAACDWADFPSNPAALTPTDGALVGAAVASVWLAAWAWKAIYKTLDDTGERGE